MLGAVSSMLALKGDGESMANIRKWIADARDLEDAGNLHGALATYRKALVAQEETSGFADLSLHNGLGDLHLRSGDLQEAVEAYESAAVQCEEQQLYANGIALCKKILRNAPGQLTAYRRLGRLFALSGLEVEARANFHEYARQLRAKGSEKEARLALGELVELTGDEEVAAELADAFAEEGRVQDALELLRSARDRRERSGRGVVTLVRKIQELQPRGLPAAPAAPVEADVTPQPGMAEIPDDAADTDSLICELHRVLSQLHGEDRFRHALPLVEHLLEMQPGRFELLHRKLAYAFALGEEGAAVSAYLALGECLDRELQTFKLRTLSTSTPSGAVTAAVNVEPASESASRSLGGETISCPT